MTPTPTRLGALALLSALLVAGCSAGSDTSSGGAAESAAGVDSAAAPEAGAAADATGGEGSAQRAQTGVLADPSAPRSIVRTGQITVEVDRLATSAARVRQAALDVGGFVASETTGLRQSADPVPLAANGEAVTRPADAGESVIVVRVPQARFAATLDAIARIGTELSRSTSAEDVTGQVADLTSRTATAKASVDRVRALLADAKDLKDVVLLESELTRREADLEAYQAQLAALTGRAELSTITSVLRTPEVVADQPNPLLRGLEQGWEALQRSVAVLLVVLGSLLPFALVAALVLAPLWVLLRRRRSPAPAAPSGPAPGATPPNPPPSDPTPPNPPPSDPPSDPTPSDPPSDPTPSDPVPAGSRD